MQNNDFRSDPGSDSALRRKTSVMIETLLNLTYLTAVEAESPVEVRKYMGLADKRLREMSRLLGEHRANGNGSHG